MNQNKCIAVILAGGKSSRMGQPKGLLDYYGEYWLLEQLRRLKSADVKSVYIGLGYDADTYFKALPFLEKALSKSINYKEVEIRIILNPEPQLGAFSTIKKVLENIPANNDALIIPIDVPLLSSKELKQLINTSGYIVKPFYKSKSGHPIKVSRTVIEKLILLADDARLDEFINSYPTSEIKQILCADWQIGYNINTLEQWKAYKLLIKNRNNLES